MKKTALNKRSLDLCSDLSFEFVWLSCSSSSWLREHSQSKQRGPWALWAQCYSYLYIFLHLQQSLFYMLSNVVFNDWAKAHQIIKWTVPSGLWQRLHHHPHNLHTLRNSGLSKQLQNILPGWVLRLLVFIGSMHLISSAPCLKAQQCVCTTWQTSSSSSTGPLLTERGPISSGWRSRDAFLIHGQELWVQYKVTFWKKFKDKNMKPRLLFLLLSN